MRSFLPHAEDFDHRFVRHAEGLAPDAWLLSQESPFRQPTAPDRRSVNVPPVRPPANENPRHSIVAVAFFLLWCTSAMHLISALGRHDPWTIDLFVTAGAVVLATWGVADRIVRRAELVSKIRQPGR